MAVFLTIMLSLGISCMVGSIIMEVHEIPASSLVGIIGGIFFASSLWFFIFQNPNSPTALDVYQGKTTLEITYKDGVAIDSVVVFKDKK